MGRHDVLPFPRGTTLLDKLRGTSPDANTGLQLVGRCFCTNDTQNSTGLDVWLRVVKNDSGSALTASNMCLAFGTATNEHGRLVKAVTSTKGQVGKPYDDAYAASFSIPANAVFYVVEEGPCKILSATAGTVTGLGVGNTLTTDADGRFDDAVVADDDHILGSLMKDVATTNTAYLVYVAGGITDNP